MVKEIEGFNINAANAAASEMEKRVKIELQIIEAIRSVAEIKSFERGLKSTNESLEKHINRNKGYLAEIKNKVIESEMKEASEREKSEARIATLLDKEAERTKEIDASIKEAEQIGKEKAEKAEADSRCRVNTAKRNAEVAEAKAAEADRKRNDAESAFASVKDKYLSV